MSTTLDRSLTRSIAIVEIRKMVHRWKTAAAARKPKASVPCWVRNALWLGWERRMLVRVWPNEVGNRFEVESDSWHDRFWKYCFIEVNICPKT